MGPHHLAVARTYSSVDPERFAEEQGWPDLCQQASAKGHRKRGELVLRASDVLPSRSSSLNSDATSS